MIKSCQDYETLDVKDFIANVRRAEECPAMQSALEKLCSCPIERVFDLKSDWITAGGTSELRVTFHPGDDYREFMAAFRAVAG